MENNVRDKIKLFENTKTQLTTNPFDLAQTEETAKITLSTLPPKVKTRRKKKPAKILQDKYISVIPVGESQDTDEIQSFSQYNAQYFSSGKLNIPVPHRDFLAENLVTSSSLEYENIGPRSEYANIGFHSEYENFDWNCHEYANIRVNPESEYENIGFNNEEQSVRKKTYQLKDNKTKAKQSQLEESNEAFNTSFSNLLFLEPEKPQYYEDSRSNLRQEKKISINQAEEYDELVNPLYVSFFERVEQSKNDSQEFDKNLPTAKNPLTSNQPKSLFSKFKSFFYKTMPPEAQTTEELEKENPFTQISKYI